MQGVRDIDIEIVEERKRPVPLKHYLYFKDYGIGQASHITPLRKRAQARYAKTKIRPILKREPLRHFPRLCRETSHSASLSREAVPCLYFCFSRRGCEENAKSLALGSRLRFLNEEQTAQILKQFDELCLQFDIAEEKKIAESVN